MSILEHTLRRPLVRISTLVAIVTIGLVALILPASAADCSARPAPGLDWSDCRKNMIMIPRSDLEGANLVNTDFTGTDLSHSNLKAANLSEASLLRASLADANAEKANFTEVEAYRSSFKHISADSASFKNAELQRTNFTGAKLTGANFEKAELGRADFDNAVLTGARFSYADLSRADLTQAKFEGALLLDHTFMLLTRIEGVDLSAAQGLHQDQINHACGDDNTKLPPGLKTPSAWPCPPDEAD
ncbi:pentapeptide repeat-containing protein [Candidatus Phyllobacterium onerii]|uniref:pentapeptide repeat-containing protein n=1 Tax=Candidatus Phyllobacterium onerii TaxID=3020828 RepID=UPI00232CEDA7|nr:pentapeptide repeat-containing protein [Phyllobacterium sp. IY22]